MSCHWFGSLSGVLHSVWLLSTVDALLFKRSRRFSRYRILIGNKTVVIRFLELADFHFQSCLFKINSPFSFIRVIFLFSLERRHVKSRDERWGFNSSNLACRIHYNLICTISKSFVCYSKLKWQLVLEPELRCHRRTFECPFPSTVGKHFSSGHWTINVVVSVQVADVLRTGNLVAGLAVFASIPTLYIPSYVDWPQSSASRMTSPGGPWRFLAATRSISDSIFRCDGVKRDWNSLLFPPRSAV